MERYVENVLVCLYIKNESIVSVTATKFVVINGRRKSVTGF